jgi:hypothetical protein
MDGVSLAWWEDDSPSDTHDSRSALEAFLFPYPRSFADFEKAEQLGLYIPHLFESVSWMIAAAIALTLLRNVFHA